MDAVTLLKNDHRTVDALFDRFLALGEGSPEAKTGIVHQVIRELSVHASIEEQILYPGVKEVLPDGGPLADEAIDEHEEMKRVLADLDGMDATDEGYDEKVRTLIADVRHHVEEEEGEMFPKLQGALPAAHLDELGARMERAKVTAPTRPHPHAPSTPPGNVVVGAVAGVVDRVRDTVSGRPARKPSATRPRSTSKTPAKRTSPSSRSSRSTSAKTAAKKSSAKRSAAKATTRKRSTKATTAKKSTTRKATAKKSTAKRSTAKKSAAKRSTAKKSAAKRRTTRPSTTSRRGPVIHVTPAPRGGWRAAARGSRAVATGDRKPDVVRKARDAAKRRGGSLVIHGADGQIQEERSYGSDPRRSRG